MGWNATARARVIDTHLMTSGCCSVSGAMTIKSTATSTWGTFPLLGSRSEAHCNRSMWEINSAKRIGLLISPNSYRISPTRALPPSTTFISEFQDDMRRNKSPQKSSVESPKRQDGRKNKDEKSHPHNLPPSGVPGWHHHARKCCDLTDRNCITFKMKRFTITSPVSYAPPAPKFGETRDSKGCLGGCDCLPIKSFVRVTSQDRYSIIFYWSYCNAGSQLMPAQGKCT